MAAALFGLSENPFKLTPDPRFVHCGARFQDVRHALRHTLLAGDGIAVIIARPGMGKTMLLELVAEDLRRDRPDWSVRLLNSDPGQTVEDVLAELGAAPTILLLDEAQRLPPEMLRRLGELADEDGTASGAATPLRIALAGAPSLDGLVADDRVSPFRRRIALRRRLDPLPDREVEAFIAERLQSIGRDRSDIFSDAAVAAIIRCSSGVPRLINTLCATAMFLAEFEGMRRVSAERVIEAARRLNLAPVDPAVLDGPSHNGASATDAAVGGSVIDGTAIALTDEPPPVRYRQRRRLRLALVGGLAAALVLVALRQGIVSNGGAVDEPMRASAPWHPTPPPALAGLWLEEISPGSANGEALEARLDTLLTRARTQLAALALTTPAGDNAFETYQEILTLEPGNADALRGIRALGGRYADLAQEAAGRGHYRTARIYYERGLAVAPRHPALLALSGRSWLAPPPQRRTQSRTRETAIGTDSSLSLTEPWTNRGGRR